MLSSLRNPVGVEALDIESRARKLCELAASEEGLNAEMLGIVRFLLQAKLLLMISKCEDVPYRAAFVVDLEQRSKPRETVIEKLMRAQTKGPRICITSSGNLLLFFKTPGSSLLIGYAVKPRDHPGARTPDPDQTPI